MSNPFLAEHKPSDFEEPKPIRCLSDQCPYLHCPACTFKLAKGEESYSCFKCDGVFPLKP